MYSPRPRMHAVTQYDSTIDDRDFLVSEKCTSTVGDDAGYRVNSDSGKSYGPQVNDFGVGWYIMERTSRRVDVVALVWDDDNVPDEVEGTDMDGQKGNPNTWRQPQADHNT